MSLLVPARTLRCAGTRCKGEIFMKKLICLLLSLLMLCGISAIAVSADGEYSNLTIHYYKFGESNGYDICIIEASPKPAELQEIIGEYLFIGAYLPGGIPDYQTAIYAGKEDEQIHLEDAGEQGLVNMDEVAEMVDGFYQKVGGASISYTVIRLGDVDNNKKLEVADVLLIQKEIAKIHTGIERALCDLSKDGEVNLEDVLLLQKKLAKLVP